MRGLNLKEIMSKSNMNQQGLNIATYGQAYAGQKKSINFLRNFQTSSCFYQCCSHGLIQSSHQAFHYADL